MSVSFQEGRGEGTLLVSAALREGSGSSSKLMFTKDAPDDSGCSTVAAWGASCSPRRCSAIRRSASSDRRFSSSSSSSYRKTVCVAFNTGYVRVNVCDPAPSCVYTAFKLWLYPYLPDTDIQGTRLCVCVCVSYLFFHTVVLINCILVLRSSDAKKRSQSLSHVVTHCSKHTHIQYR